MESKGGNFDFIAECNRLEAVNAEMLEILKRLYDAMLAGHSINPYEYRAVVGETIAKAERGKS